MEELAKLATVSRILYDKVIIEQQQQIERLRLLLFWTRNNRYKLKDAFRQWNEQNVRCYCQSCIQSNRANQQNLPQRPEREEEAAAAAEAGDEDEVVVQVIAVVEEEEEIKECKFASALTAKLREFGVTFEYEPAEHNHSVHPYIPEECASPADVHLVFSDPGLKIVTFGQKLITPASVRSPEILLYQRLLRFLLHGQND